MIGKFQKKSLLAWFVVIITLIILGSIPLFLIIFNLNINSAQKEKYVGLVKEIHLGYNCNFGYYFRIRGWARGPKIKQKPEVSVFLYGEKISKNEDNFFYNTKYYNSLENFFNNPKIDEKTKIENVEKLTKTHNIPFDFSDLRLPHNLEEDNLSKFRNQFETLKNTDKNSEKEKLALKELADILMVKTQVDNQIIPYSENLLFSISNQPSCGQSQSKPESMPIPPLPLFQSLNKVL